MVILADRVSSTMAAAECPAEGEQSIADKPGR
jgi:hypothetical protein